MQTPTQEQITSARAAAGHSQSSAADAVGVKLRAWQYYEAGREMPAGLWELYLLKTGQHPKMVLEARGKGSHAAAGTPAVLG